MAFVGEAPADEETLEGKPLVGPSGRLFDKLLRLNNIERADCLVTNVVDIQAPNNDIDKLLCGKSVLPPEPGAYNLPYVTSGRYFPVHLIPQLERLKAEIEACRPNLVVCMGGLAAWAFLGPTPIRDSRGAIASATSLVPGQKIMATYHPANTFHDPKSFTLIAMDFAKAGVHSTTRTTDYRNRRIVIEPSILELEDFATEITTLGFQREPLGVDLETIPSARHIKCISLASGPNYAMVVPFLDSRKVSRSYWPDVETETRAWMAVKAICESPVPKVLQNGVYDFRYLYDHGIEVRNYLHDTKLQHHALFPELPKDLGTLVACYAHERPWKLWRGKRDGRKREE